MSVYWPGIFKDARGYRCVLCEAQKKIGYENQLGPFRSERYLGAFRVLFVDDCGPMEHPAARVARGRKMKQSTAKEATVSPKSRSPFEQLTGRRPRRVTAHAPELPMLAEPAIEVLASKISDAELETAIARDEIARNNRDAQDLLVTPTEVGDLVMLARGNDGKDFASLDLRRYEALFEVDSATDGAAFISQVAGKKVDFRNP
eukprot:g20892.t1